MIPASAGRGTRAVPTKRVSSKVDECDCLRRIDDCVARVTPDDPSLVDWSADYGRSHRYRLAGDLQLIRQYASREHHILELGSLPPFLTLALTECDYQVEGIDLAPERFADAIRRYSLRIQKLDMETRPLPFPDESFEMILLDEVFEHLRIDLIFTMTEVRRVLKAGGLLLLSTPNLYSARGIWALLRHQTACHVGADLFTEYAKLRRFGHMGHVREYTVSEVREFLQLIGFHVQQVLFRCYEPPELSQQRHPFRTLLERFLYPLAPRLKPQFTLICGRMERSPQT